MNLATLTVMITGNAGPLHRTLAEVQGTLGRFGARNASVGGLLGGGAALSVGLGGAAVGAAAYGFVRASMGAADLAESVSKLHFLMGDAEKGVLSFADKMATSFGLPKREMIDASVQIGMIGKSIGMAQPKAAAFSEQMVKLAADASSFYNVPMSQALEKITSGLIGMERPLREWGVLVDENAVKQEAARLGIARFGTELTQQEKVQARVSLITRQMAVATGDLERTQGSAKNQVRLFWGSLQNLRDTIGGELLPYFTELVQAANRFIHEFAVGFQQGTGLGGKFRDMIREVMLALANSETYWKIWQTQAAIAIARVTHLFDQIVSKWDFLRAHILTNPLQLIAPQVNQKDWAQQIGAIMIQQLGKALGGPGKGFGALGAADLLPKEMLSGKPLDFSGGEAVKQLMQELADLRAKLEAARKPPGAVAAGGIPPPPWAQPEAEVRKPGKTEQAYFDLAEFAKKLQSGVFKDDAKKTADNTAGMFKALQDIGRDVKKAVGGAAGIPAIPVGEA